MPRLKIVSVQGGIHAPLNSAEAVWQARVMADGVANLTPDGATIRVYEGHVPVMEVYKDDVVQPGLFYCEEIE